MRKLSIAQAGTALRRSYNQILRLLMLGQLKGGQDEHGRWYVDADDVQRIALERSAAAVGHAA